MAAAVDWPLLWTVRLRIDVQLEDATQVSKLEEKLRLEKDVQLSTTLLLELGDMVREQDTWETLSCHFAKLGRHQLPWIKAQVLVTKPDWDTKRWNL